MTFFEFLIVNQYIFLSKLSFEEIENKYKKFSKEGKNFVYKIDVLLYDQFESFTIECDLLDDKIFDTFMKLHDVSKLKSILYNIQEELKGSVISVFNEIYKRFQILAGSKDYSILIHKCDNLKLKITEIDFISQDLGDDKILTIWLSLRILDEISFNIYNE
jgi:hypothetical protein